MTRRINTVIVGGGQAGLSVGRQLQKRDVEHVIFDSHERVGDAWRTRWDSLKLFTPARYDGLADLPFPASGSTFPTKDAMADYLESYAEHFRLPVRTGVKVTRVGRSDGLFAVETTEGDHLADNVVIAMSNLQVPTVPELAAALSEQILQIHSSSYRGPDQIRPGRVLVVGVGNSGADIALELSRSHDTWLAGTIWAHVPFRIEPWLARNVGIRIVRFMGHHILTRTNPIGRKMGERIAVMGAPLVRVKPDDLVAAGVTRLGRVVATDDGLPVTDDGTAVDADTVVWCTGFKSGFPTWIDLPIFGDDGLPIHDRGVVADVPGISFVGIEFLHSETSGTVTGVTRDAIHVARAVAARKSPSTAVL